MLTTGAIERSVFTCFSVDLDLTAWLASAGIIGVAVGFAAQYSLANVFAGVSIKADAPYNLGDHLLLESGERGEVTDIGLRSTRLRTRGDIQIVVPNSIMAETKIVNESGGPRRPHRISLVLGVAYGTDVDAMKDIVIDECVEVEDVLKHPPPNVLFTAFGDSALLFDVLVSIQNSQRAFVLDGMHMRIYKRLAKEGIEIPSRALDSHETGVNRGWPGGLVGPKKNRRENIFLKSLTAARRRFLPGQCVDCGAVAPAARGVALRAIEYREVVVHDGLALDGVLHSPSPRSQR